MRTIHKLKAASLGSKVEFTQLEYKALYDVVLTEVDENHPIWRFEDLTDPTEKRRQDVLEEHLRDPRDENTKLETRLANAEKTNAD